MTRIDALGLEGWLQVDIKAGKRNRLYRKHHPEKRDGRHYPSAGQATTDGAGLHHSV